MDDSLTRILSAVEFDVLWEQLGFGPTPVALALDSPGHTHRERAAIVADAVRGLRARGLADADGPEPELARLLTLLARPTAQLEVRAWLGRPLRAVAAERDDAGVRAVRGDTTVTLRACGSLAVGVAELVPPAPPGPGRSATVPADALATAAGGPRLREALLARGVPPADAGLLARMLDGVGNRCQVVALAADRWGVPRRLPAVVTLLDTPRGRYLLTRSAAADGTAWATVTPADARTVRARLAELLGAAADAAAAVA